MSELKEELRMKNEETFGKFPGTSVHSAFCILHSAF